MGWVPHTICIGQNKRNIQLDLEKDFNHKMKSVLCYKVATNKLTKIGKAIE